MDPLDEAQLWRREAQAERARPNGQTWFAEALEKEAEKLESQAGSAAEPPRG